MGRMSLLTRAAILLLVAALGPAAPAAAQDGDDERGRFHFQAGASYYEAGEYEQALREFERSYEISKRPQLFYNISLAHQQLGDLESAILYLDRYLREVEEIPNRVNLERRLENLRKRLEEHEEAERQAAEETETDTGTDAGTGTDVGTGTQTETEAEIGAEGGDEAGAGGESGFVGDTRTRGVDMDEGPGVPAGAWIGWGVGAGSLVVGAVLGGLALKEKNDVADSPCGQAGTCTSDEVQKMDRMALASDVMMAVGIAGAVTGTVLFFVMRDGASGEREAAAGVDVAPWVDPSGGGGAVVEGRF
ncbi:MAG: tetratricopeptide repeat protein [Myxococcota bacterium]